MSSTEATPDLSRSSSSSSTRERNKRQLSLDLSDLPQLSQPSQPTNTLIITNLNDPSIFSPDSLGVIHAMISQWHPIHTFSPLKSFRRLLVSFRDPAASAAVRAALDGGVLLGSPIRVYFGTHTPVDVDPATLHLRAPKADRLFFISPPPSPPAGWAMKNEDPPNKEVHAHDLSVALERLHDATTDRYAELESSPVQEDEKSPVTNAKNGEGRSRGSTVVYRPEDHGNSPNLPAIEVEDTGIGEVKSPEGLSPIGSGFPKEIDEVDRKYILHTSRPPVELGEE
ncbi:Calcipressin-domain-containing protein [Eremomyces bilateralis CBS 781.70]|uniref:Calcipressin-domain-containing protein n=1 Tax=Eremomyces bilateralis CBS 781.70 TaxID=1392243 RepID=A0A6G1FZK4_9PEZI|nr:Calcipressin-domain-containing protein [Eremomyces bilateralis CBS 781.70]KAF1811208.1 Calcipressin-domain-containing protein [Eremomyces bilateralis CBS 781.70]